MALDVQHQSPQPFQQVHVRGVAATTKGGDCHHIATSLCHLATPITLDLLPYHHLNSTIELEESSPLPFGWQKFLNIKTGEIYYSKIEELEGKSMNRRNGPRLDLKLNLSPPERRTNPPLISPNRSSTVSPTSTPSSCVSSEVNQDNSVLWLSTSPEVTSMILVGCPRCFMYVMVNEDDPKCPKCKSIVLLDVIHEKNKDEKTQGN